MVRRLALLSAVLVLLGCQAPLSGQAANHITALRAASPSFSATTGAYRVQFSAKSGVITVTPKGKTVHLAIREIGVGKTADLFNNVTSVRRSGSVYTLSGKASWTSFVFKVTIDPTLVGLLHLTLSLTPLKSSPQPRHVQPDVQLVGARSSTLKQYDPAPPIAGTSVYLSNVPLKSSILYLENLTTLGKFFDRTQTGAAQTNFAYPRAGGKGGLVGLGGSYFGYPPPISTLDNLPRKRSTLVLDSYLYLLPGVPATEAAVSETYLKLLGGVNAAVPTPSIPGADWHTLAQKTASDLADPSNLVTMGGKRFLISYVSDSRTSPELLTQATVLAGMKAYEARFHETLPLASVLEDNLSAFYDSTFHTVKNGLGHDQGATEESWYYITNLISLLQIAQQGSATAKELLMNSVQGAISLAHTNNYEFPQNFHFSDWNGQGTGLQSDVAGGYAWLMLGLYDMTKDTRYLDEAKASITHVNGKGFGLAYETHMLGYTAAAAERLYTMTNDEAYRGYAVLALANLFHVTRLWDCTYGTCVKGAGYHTYFGINPLPWADYVAMLEQYEAWLGLKDYMTYAAKEPVYVRNLVQAFLTETPLTMQYTLPTKLPPGVATSAAGEYSFVTRNILTWNIPLEDLRLGEQNSGIIGQEIYGAGGPFMLAAYS